MKSKKKKIKISTIRHSLAHILALAVLRFWPKVKFGIGPATEEGFFYDFDFGNKEIKLEDLEKIEEEMKKIVKSKLPFRKSFVPIKEAKKIFRDQPYKLEILDDLEKSGKKEVSLYQVGEFIDLCKGPHVRNTGEIDPQTFKLVNISGAYWKGDESNRMLTRISGLAFATSKELKSQLELLEEIKKRDHRVLGKNLDIFIFDEEVGAGLPLWPPKGEMLREIIRRYLTDHYFAFGYQLVGSPHIANIVLWQRSGHWDFYRENIYSPIQIDNEKYLLKPMNCPFHIKIYQEKIRSWRDLPIKLAELGTVYRYERSGTLHGLTRVRGFTQDDAHIFVQKEGLKRELVGLIKEIKKVLKDFGFKDYQVFLSTRPKKYIGTLKIWREAERALREALKEEKVSYQVDKGGGAFYGPKIDVKIKDALGRLWQCSTIQVDFNLPERFDINFINSKGKKERVVMVHRAIVGSLERFIGVLIEHYNGAFPFWLSPEQIWVLPLSEKHLKEALKIKRKLEERSLRVEVKEPDLSLGKRIFMGEKEKIPYLLIIGDKELKNKSVSVRERKKGDLGEMKIEKFLSYIEKDIEKSNRFYRK